MNIASTDFQTDIGGLLTHALSVGTGAPVVLLHGWGASSALMRPLAERLAVHGCRALAPDLPGFGQTPLPPSVWGVADYAKHVVAWLDALALERVTLIGHSFGGRIGIVLGAEFAHRLDRLVLIDSAGVPPRPKPGASARLRLYKRVRETLTRVGLGSLAERLRAWYNARYGSPDFQAAGALRETLVRVINEDLLPYAARIAVPTLLLWGEHDADTPLWQGEALEAAIPDAGLVVLEGAGHYSYLDRLDDATRIISHFITHA